MSDKVRAWVWDLELPPARKLILLWLAGRATDNGVAFPGEREIREKTGLCERMVRYHIQALADHDVGELHGNPGPLLLRVERRVHAFRNTSNLYVLRVPWAEPAAVRRDLAELKHITEAALSEVLARVGVGATGCPHLGAAGCREESSLGNRHQNTPQPPVGRQQQGLTEEPTKSARDRSSPDAPQPAEAAKLAEAFYRGLGGEAISVTAALRRRDLVIASDLVAAGATPSEANAYAVEAPAVAGRIAPVDLRSFERERLGWLARRSVTRRERRGFVDRTGQPPSWQMDQPPTAQVDAREAAGEDLTETEFGRALHAILLTGR